VIHESKLLLVYYSVVVLNISTVHLIMI